MELKPAPESRSPKPGQTRLALDATGSLYIGKGLGVKKATPWIPQGGTTKQLLRGILQAKQIQNPDATALPCSEEGSV